MPRKPWEQQERRLVKQTGGERSAGSGAFSRKGDVRSSLMLIEAKTTGKQSYTIQAKELEKIWREALIDGRMPVLQFDLNGTAYAIIPWDDLLGLLGE